MAKYQTTAAAQPQDAESEPRRLWHGLIAFATIMLLLSGAFHLIGGFIALFEDDQYLVGERDLMVTVSYRWFGIAHMAVGVLMLLASYALFWGRTWGRAVAIVVAMVSAITNLATLSSDPSRFTLMIALDVLVIYAVAVHGSENREY
jgi:hypothetical protein